MAPLSPAKKVRPQSNLSAEPLDESDDTKPYGKGHHDGTDSGYELHEAPASLIEEGACRSSSTIPLHY
jgi:hypothetical protein